MLHRCIASGVISLTCLVTSSLFAGHPTEDYYRSRFHEETSRQIASLTWLQIKHLPQQEAIALLKKEHPPTFENGKSTKHQVIFHQNGFSLIEIVSTNVYTVTTTTRCIDEPITGEMRTSFQVDFQLNSKPSKAAIKRAAIVEEELESAAYRNHLIAAHRRYERQHVFEGEAATRKSFERDFVMPPIEGVKLTPSISLFDDYCQISLLVEGDGIVGEASIRSPMGDESVQPIIDAIVGRYSVHVWAK